MILGRLTGLFNFLLVSHICGSNLKALLYMEVGKGEGFVNYREMIKKSSPPDRVDFVGVA